MENGLGEKERKLAQKEQDTLKHFFLVKAVHAPYSGER